MSGTTDLPHQQRLEGVPSTSSSSDQDLTMVKVEPRESTTPYTSLFTPWASFLSSPNGGSLPFPSPASPSQGQATFPSSGGAIDSYMSWSSDAGGMTFGGTGFTPGWQMSGIFSGVGVSAGNGAGGAGWTLEAEKDLTNALSRSSFAVKEEDVQEEQRRGDGGASEFARAVEQHSRRTSGTRETQARDQDQNQGFELGMLPIGGHDPFKGNSLQPNAFDQAVRPAVAPLQPDSSETVPSRDSSGISNDLMSASNDASRSSDSTTSTSFDSTRSRSVDGSLDQHQLRRASHIPRHIVDLSAESPRSMSDEQVRLMAGAYLGAGYPSQGMLNYSGFSNPYQGYQQYSNDPYNSVDPMSHQLFNPQSQSQYYPTRSHPLTFIAIPNSNASIAPEIRLSSSNHSVQASMPYPTQQASRDSSSSNGLSISPAVLNPPSSRGIVRIGAAIGQANQNGNTIHGSPVSVHSGVSEHDPNHAQRSQSVSRSNSVSDLGRTVDRRASSPHHRSNAHAHAHGHGGGSARHPYMEEYNRRNVEAGSGNGNALASSSTPAHNPRVTVPRKKSSNKSTKRSSPTELHPVILADVVDPAIGAMNSAMMDYSDEDGGEVEGENEDGEGGDGDIPEGIERDGMMWGMKTEAYRALSARERKRVRNRISARTFRARRKEHLIDLESGMVERNAVLKDAQDTIRRLRQENSDLARRLSKYEAA